MEAITERELCISRPWKIIQLFGLDVYLGMLFRKNKSFLQRISEKYSRHQIEMPGSVGNAYKLSALFEYRLARIYTRMAERFKDHPAARALFLDLKEEEMEHARLMMVCLCTVRLEPSVQFIPSVRDADIRDSLNELRKLEKRVDSLSLNEALDLTDQLERGEVNVIFGKLLNQVGREEIEFFSEQFKGIEGHSESVPRRTRKLREQIASAAA